MFSRIWKTKTFWTGITLIITGLGGYFTESMDPKTAFDSVIAGILAIVGRDAIAKV